MAGHADPAAEYRRRLEARGSAEAAFGRQARRLSLARLGTFALAFLAAWLALLSGVLSALWVLPPLAGFGALVVIHDRVLKRRESARRRAALYRTGLERLAGRWAGKGSQGTEYLETDHPYAADLDVFGPGSLFEHLATVRTRAGEATLARWLQHAAAPDAVRARQKAVEELRGRLDLREDLALLGEAVRSRLDPEALVAWGAGEPWRPALGTRLACLAASAFSLTTLITWLATLLGGLVANLAGLWFGLALIVHSILLAALRKRVEPVVSAVEEPSRDLAVLSGLLARIDAEPVESPRLVALRAALETEGKPPASQIARLERLVQLLDARRNQLFAPIGVLTFWTFHLAAAVEAWRGACGAFLPAWLEAAGEAEALAALAGHAYEHPADPFPELAAEGPLFEAEGLAHPLLLEAEAVPNDVRLDTEPQAWVVSGSNMSGKSTLLRAVGTNAILALAGAPVRARRLRLSPLALGASIRVLDSLLEGKSRFYAEIVHLQRIASLCNGATPALFLLDELLAGTNSHDRRIGAEALVRTLVAKGAIGMLTTHDLALAEVAESLAPAVANVHFEDSLVDGALSFDYRLRPGVVTKSNALELMRSVGLEV